MRAQSRFGRTGFMARLLGLPGHAGEDGAPGLVLIQIDGLSQAECARALERREMPFLSGLLRRRDYEIRQMYSGLPSNTPAMQGELFYGVPGAVPAFGFFDREAGRLRRM